MQAKILSLCLFFSLVYSAALFAQSSPVGTWRTVDDETGKSKSHLEIFEKDGKLTRTFRD